MGPRRSGTGRLGTPGGLKTPEMAPMGGTPPKIISNSIDDTVDTSKEDTTALLKSTTIQLSEKLLKVEERTLFLGELVRTRRGTKEVENFVQKQGG